MFVFYDWPFPHLCTLQRMQPISLLILGSVFSDYVVFYGDSNKVVFKPRLNMSLHCLVKYLCSKNRHAQEVIEDNCRVRKNCFKIFVW